MIRNLIIAILLCSPLFCQAQSEWETPNAVKPKTEKPKKADKEEAKKGSGQGHKGLEVHPGGRRARG